ncbi:MAG: acetylglutamate kinase [Clostridiales Family XIII bacterium]|nr:acetylglutamate kinase [Clostridiales Family XIII bacterium]
MDEVKKRADVLAEALPYIQKYDDKIVVVKYGGAAMLTEGARDSVMRDIVLLNQIGVRIVLVHGGGPEISDTLKQLGKETRFIDGLRYTDAETAEIACMVLAGKVNKSLVSLIHKAKGRAIGLCGVDDAMLRVKKTDKADLGFVGDIVAVNVNAVRSALDGGLIPVIATVGVDENGQVYNINADTAAAEVAAALGAEALIMMTDVRGLLRDKDDPDSLIPEISADDIPGLVASGVISGGMLPKVDGLRAAIAHGLKEAVVIDGRVPHAILLELLSDSGFGTLIK